MTTLLVALVASVCRNMIEANTAACAAKQAQSSSLYAYHLALNIALFPVLFFFSGLYYTDVASTLVVMVAYQNHLSRSSRLSNTLANDVWTVILGICTLFMRQTNVFWVVVYMGGLEAVHAIHALRPGSAERLQITTVSELARHYAWTYSTGDVHDPPLNMSWPDGMFVVPTTSPSVSGRCYC